ncbi:histidine phosphatase family protein [Micromonospora aurantiaca (nom. illeg.)]|uniref:histidine phosphatase family protein n=1 Tax=Micromonospora aurantiaca (nom. illeg.) TaxID=47850 RepID=UPI003F4A31B9
MTTTSLWLVAHAHTPALRQARFAAHTAGLDEGGRRAALVLGQSRSLAAATTCVSSPATAAIETARLISGRDPTIMAGLADADYGRWNGLTLGDVAAEDPDGLRLWRENPNASPHGGETLAAVVDRVGSWLATHLDRGGQILAVTHPVIVRAALLHVMQVPPSNLWQVDVAPGARLHLRSNGRRFHVHLDPPGD